MADPKFWVPYLKWDAFIADSPAETGGDPDTDPDLKGIHGGVTVTAALSKGDVRAVRALTEPEHQLFALGTQDTRLDEGFLKLTASQQEFGLLGKCSVLDIPEDVDLIYTFRPHHITYNGAPQDLPTITVKAPVIPDAYDPVVSGPLVVNLADAEWLDASTAVTGGFIIRQIPDGFVRNLLTIQAMVNGDALGDPIDISDLMWDGTADSIADATVVGKSVMRAVDAAAARDAIGAISGGDYLASAIYDPNLVAGDVFDQDNMVDGTTNKNFTVVEQSKLSGVDEGATANSTDASLRDRSTHTGAQTASTISDFNAAADARISAAAGVTVPDLVGGVVPTAQVPAQALTTVQEADSEVEMLGLPTQEGDVVIRSDEPATYIHNGGSAGTMADFTVLPNPAGAVASVNGQMGTVVLGRADIGLGSVDNTADVDKPVSTAQQDALDLKAPKADPTFTGTVSGVTKAHVGLDSVDNTSDLDKPVSAAMEAALDDKLDESLAPVQITQAAYDALGPGRPARLYAIVG